jgi:hypothetical protein
VVTRRSIIAALSTAVVLAAAAPAHAVNLQPDDTIVTNGFVTAIQQVGSKVYVGGSFTRVGPRTGPAAGLDPATGQDLGWPEPGTGGPSNPDFLSTEPIEVVISDGSGGWYVGGRFATFGGVTRASLVHLKPDKSVDTDFNASVGGVVTSLARDGSNLYVGGSFTSIGGGAHSRLAKLNGATGEADASWNPAPDKPISALALSADNSTLYVAGFNLSQLGSTPKSRAFLGAVSTAGTGAATDFDPQSDNFVRSLAVVGTTVYAGGSFTTIGGQNRTALAALNGDTGAAVTAFNPSPLSASANVNAIVPSGSTLFVGGAFSSIGGQTRSNIAQINTSDGTATTTFNPGVSAAPGSLNTSVKDLALVGPTLYVAGFFDTVGGQGRRNLAAVSPTDGTPSAWNPSPMDGVSSIAATASVVYIGGRFSSGSTTAQTALAAVDAATGQLTSGAPAVSGGGFTRVSAMAAIGSTLYLGGTFTSVGGQTHARIAAVDTTNGTAIVGFNASTNNEVIDIDVSGSTVYMAGPFTTVGGQPHEAYGAVNATNGAVLPWDPEVNGTDPIGPIGARAIAVGGDSVYLAGDFSKVKGADRIWAAAVDPLTAAIKPWNPDPDYTASAYVIAAILPAGNTVYLTGLFHSLGDFDYSTRIAEVFADTGAPTDWDAPVFGVGAAALANSGTTIFAASDNSTIFLKEFARSDGTPTAFSPQFTGFSPPGQAETLYLAPDGSLYAGGNFTALGDFWQQGFAKFSGGTPPPVAPANTGAPSITGTPAAGQTLSCSSGTWTGTDPISYTYTWLRDGAAVAGPAAGSTYAVTAADEGHQIVCRVTAQNSGGSLSADSVAVSVPVPEPPPPPDADGDGVPDASDACPAVSDAASPRSPRTGCPAEVSGGGGPKPTAGNDKLSGDGGANTICGLGGSDTIDGKGGNDTLFGDACRAKARLVAGAPVFAAAANGNDTLLGSDGNDSLFGAAGNDTLKGGKGKDKLFGGRGNDKLDGGPGVNSYSGGAGNDVVSAKNGKKETVDCGAGKKDRATVDKKDRVKKCEKVKRSRK